MGDLVRRRLQIDLRPRQSAFLWGPRKTGKSTLLKMSFPDSIRYDFLRSELLIEVTKRPAIIREQLLAAGAHAAERPIVLDEVQKVPGLLDEVQGMIEDKGRRFILCGSSARKLKRGKGKLLGGPAWRFELFPFVTPELDAPDLLQILNRGLVPSHYCSPNWQRSLAGYVRDYL